MTTNTMIKMNNHRKFNNMIWNTFRNTKFITSS